MIIAKYKSKVVGFLQIIISKDSFTIDLIGVHQKYQRRGLAKAMITFSQGKNYNIKYMYVGTQMINSSSLNLYQKLNFRIYDSKYVLHYHNTI